MIIDFQEHDLDAVMRYFADGFKPGEGEKIRVAEWFIDISKRKVIFKFYVDKEKEDKP